MNAKKSLHTEIIQNILIITLDTPGEKVNKLNEGIIHEFSEILDKLESDETLQGAVLTSGKEDNFIAGADIGMFKSRETAAELEELSRAGHAILLRIEQFSKPVVVAIHGSCMGGGTELALACHYRIVSDHSSTKIALPEVKLGLLPGMGGTQRLPRLIGIQKALTYMLTGKNMYSHQALKTGFANERVHRHTLLSAAMKAVKQLKSVGSKNPDKRTLLEKSMESNPAGRHLLFKLAGKRILDQTYGNYPAPLTIIESVSYGYKYGFDQGLDNEAKRFGELAVTQESRALVELFFAMNAAKKNPLENKKREIRTIGVLGAGLMGTGITEVSIDVGFHVWLKDQTMERAMEGWSFIEKSMNKKMEKRILTPFERDEKMSRAHPVSRYERFRNTDLVVEAVFENLELKHQIIEEIEKVCGEQTIIASNTSSIPITDIAAHAARPENIIGMHYFSPVQKMPLLEIIKTKKTADWVTASAYELGLKQGKTVIVVNDGPGFYTTRILAPYINEALLLLEEGAAVEQLDNAMKQFGFPVGPVALLDDVGIDVGAHVGDVLGKLFRERGAKTSSKAEELMKAGYLGRKNRKGFYRYGDRPKKKKEVNTDIYSFFSGSDRQKFLDSEIQERMVMMMVNEAVLCLQEGIIKSPADGDLGAVLGLGFPPFLGGPFRYLDRLGCAVASDLLDTLENDCGPRFSSAGLLEEMAENDEGFYR